MHMVLSRALQSTRRCGTRPPDRSGKLCQFHRPAVRSSHKAYILKELESLVTSYFMIEPVSEVGDIAMARPAAGCARAT